MRTGLVVVRVVPFVQFALLYPILLALHVGPTLEMCLKRKGKNREQQRNWKERFSFLFCSFIFWHPFFPLFGQNREKKAKKGAE